MGDMNIQSTEILRNYKNTYILYIYLIHYYFIHMYTYIIHMHITRIFYTYKN